MCHLLCKCQISLLLYFFMVVMRMACVTEFLCFAAAFVVLQRVELRLLFTYLEVGRNIQT